jgi:hypothetical protein
VSGDDVRRMSIRVNGLEDNAFRCALEAETRTLARVDAAERGQRHGGGHRTFDGENAVDFLLGDFVIAGREDPPFLQRVTVMKRSPAVSERGVTEINDKV